MRDAVYASASHSNIFAAADENKALEELKKFVKTHEETAPDLATWVEENISEGLTIYQLPTEHRKRMRTTNPSSEQILWFLDTPNSFLLESVIVPYGTAQPLPP